MQRDYVELRIKIFPPPEKLASVEKAMVDEAKERVDELSEALPGSQVYGQVERGPKPHPPKFIKPA